MSTVTNPGCVVFLMDESAGMGAVMGEEVAGLKASTKSNAERAATALNSLLAKLAGGPDFDVALVGYQADGEGRTNVGLRWAGPLAGREFVSTKELAAAPLRVETRTRKLPAGIGVMRDETVTFPIWYEPSLGVKAPQIAAYTFCHDLLSRWAASAPPGAAAPLVIHVFAGSSADGSPQRAVDKLLTLCVPGGSPLLLQAHLAASAGAVTSLYPSNYMYLTMGIARDLFRRCSPLPAKMVEALRAEKITINPNARGMVYNAKIVDLVRLLSLARSYTQDWPSRAAPVTAIPVDEPVAAPTASSVPPALPEPAPAEPPLVLLEEAAPVAEVPAAPALTEKAGLVVLVLDRSIEDVFGADLQNPCAKLQDYANDVLRQISRLKDGAVEVAIVSYGLDLAGQVEVRDCFDGPLAGRRTVAHTELADGAIRVDQYEEQMSDGTGGLITLKRKKPIYFDVEPTAAAPAGKAFESVAQTVAEWCGRHPAACLPPIVLHLSRGQVDAAEFEAAVAPLRAATPAAGPVVLYHWIATEAPHTSLVCPETDGELATEGLKRLWQLTSPLLGASQLAEENRGVKAESRGMVVNGKFELLLEEPTRKLS